MNALLVLTNCPEQSIAETIAHAVVASGQAACVNILMPCQSVYRWQGRIETATEIPLLIKSTAENYTALEKIICQHHPYAVPEIIALPITQGLPAYLQWISEENMP